MLKSGPRHFPAARTLESCSTPITQPSPLLHPGTNIVLLPRQKSRVLLQKSRIYFPIKSPSTHVVKHLLSFCVSTPAVHSLDVASILFHRSLRNILDPCIAASREVHYIQMCHSVSVSVYKVLRVLLLSLCIKSWKSFQLTWNSSSSLFLIAQ